MDKISKFDTRTTNNSMHLLMVGFKNI